MKRIFNLFILLLFSVSLFAQAPQKFKFQAVARDASGVPYASENLAVRVSLIRGGVSGLIDYAERHQVTTSPLGVFDLEIGGGFPLSGEMGDTDWASHPYYLKIDIDPTGGTSYLNLGTSQLLSVPYAIYAGESGNGGGGGDPTDELQNLIYDPNAQTLTLTDGNSVSLSFPGGTDDQTLSLSGTTLAIQGGNSIDLSSLQDGVNDADADPTNEMQTVSFDPVTNELSISGGNSISIPSGGTDADADPNNEIQTLTKTGAIVTLSDNGGSFTDEVNDADANASNELQTISLSDNTLTLSNNGGSIDIPESTDSQMLTFNPVTNELSISGGNVITIPSGGADADADPTNEIQTISIFGNTLALSNNGGSIDIPESTDSQMLIFNPITNELSISGGNVITIPSGGADADADPMNEIQTLSKAGSTVSLSGNGGSFTDDINDADADPTNEIETWGTLAGIPADIQDGDDVNDADADPSNEIQMISFNNVTNELSISEGNTISIPTGGSDADADPNNELQNLTLNGNTLSIEGGNQVNLANLQDGTEDADADPTNELQTLQINLGTNRLELSNGGGEVNIDLLQDGTQDADSNPTNEIQVLSFDPNSNELTISGSNTINLPIPQDDNDADPANELQVLSLNGNNLTLSNGGQVDLSGLAGSSLWNQGVGNDLYTQEQVAIGFAQSQLSTLEVKEDITIRNAATNSVVDLFSSTTGGHVYLYKGNGSGGSNDLLVNIDAAQDGGRINIRNSESSIRGEFEATNNGMEFNLYQPNGQSGIETSTNVFGGFTSYFGQSSGQEIATIGYDPSNVNAGQITYGTTSDYDLGVLSITDADEGGTMAARLEGYSTSGGRTFRLSSLSDNKAVGLLAIYNDGNPVAYMTGNAGGAIYLQESSNNRNIYLGTVSGTSNRGRIGVLGSTDNTRAGIYVDDQDRGVVWGSIKNFRMDHPTDDTKEIWYASVEGPEAAAYERGTAKLVDGEAVIEFPEHFGLVANHETMTVMLTPLSANCKGLAVVEKTATGFKVKELFQGTGTYDFDWEVKCVRKGYENYQAVREREPKR